MDRNRAYAGEFVEAEGVEKALVDILFDPQTSGGLLRAMSAADADGYVVERRRTGLPGAVIGEVTGIIRVV